VARAMPVRARASTRAMPPSFSLLGVTASGSAAEAAESGLGVDRLHEQPLAEVDTDVTKWDPSRCIRGRWAVRMRQRDSTDCQRRGGRLSSRLGWTAGRLSRDSFRAVCVEKGHAQVWPRRGRRKVGMGKLLAAASGSRCGSVAERAACRDALLLPLRNGREA
jgi:hypothetical protein